MNESPFGFQRVKVVSLFVIDSERADKFYGATLGLPPAYEGGERVGYSLGGTMLMLKSTWYASRLSATFAKLSIAFGLSPTQDPDPRITIETEDALRTERALRERGVTISDPVNLSDEFYAGGFLDSEGNKLWFCSSVKS
jgi:hypothetical protein